MLKTETLVRETISVQELDDGWQVECYPNSPIPTEVGSSSRYVFTESQDLFDFLINRLDLKDLIE